MSELPSSKLSETNPETLRRVARYTEVFLAESAGRLAYLGAILTTRKHLNQGADSAVHDHLATSENDMMQEAGQTIQLLGTMIAALGDRGVAVTARNPATDEEGAIHSLSYVPLANGFHVGFAAPENPQAFLFMGIDPSNKH